jgi:hypothetical protein
MLHSPNEPTINLSMNLPFTPWMNLMNLICMYMSKHGVHGWIVFHSYISEKGFKRFIHPDKAGFIEGGSNVNSKPNERIRDSPGGNSG